MTIDIRRIAVGDKVTIEFDVLDVDLSDHECPVRVNGSLWPLKNQIIGHKKRPIEADDLVTWLNADGDYRVVAVDGNKAWITCKNHLKHDAIAWVSDLQRVFGND